MPACLSRFIVHTGVQVLAVDLLDRIRFGRKPAILSRCRLLITPSWLETRVFLALTRP